MTGYTLKLIAMFTMLIDHITGVLVPYSSKFYIVGRSIGRLAFPIYCFLLVEGFKHTRDIKKYLARLLIFAFISEVPFDFAFYSPVRFIYDYFQHQNIFFTLFIGLLVISIIDYIDRYLAEKYHSNNIEIEDKQLIIKNILNILALLLGCLLAYILKTDYSYMGVLMIWAFYRFQDDKQMLIVSMILVNLIYGFPQIIAVFSLIFIGQYNGQKGKQGNKYLFYGFYPIHLTILFIIKQFGLI